MRAWLRARARACTQIDMHACTHEHSHTCCSTFLCRATRSRCASGAPSGVCLTARCPARHGIPHGMARIPHGMTSQMQASWTGIVSRLVWHATRAWGRTWHGIPRGMVTRVARCPAWHGTPRGMVGMVWYPTRHDIPHDMVGDARARVAHEARGGEDDDLRRHCAEDHSG